MDARDAACSGGDGMPDALAPDAALLLRLTNAARRDAKLAPLVLDAALMRSARSKCRDMAATGAFTHRSARWGGPLELQRVHGVVLRVMGAENLACHRGPRLVFLAWMASPAHRANILHPAHNRIGLEVVPAGALGVIACQEFGGA